MFGLEIVVLLVINSALGDKPADPVTQLAHDLLDDYNADVIPSGLDGGPLLVNHSLYLMHILTACAREFTGNHYDDLNAVVFSDGKVRFDPPFYSQTICPFDEAKLFTDNTVVCALRFLSWKYDGKQLDINLVDNGVNSNYLEPRPNQKWSYVESSSERTVTYYDYPEPYINVQYDLTLQRVA